ncbi:hypothetical protein TREMEDRAFT_58985 [Tremella mesenterica DSM 1558]|uniref:uncharacterized protein n=1 Tax=Tremella mesenterica (strain ATCC 24925 / CBS 8224 / DSM 1558 / NBRC 9311 / NRRL Y-6157 / RJB 2259-6 / UBC 559-6) TaxID=578456 RepID=UPI0003F4A5B4|nr:uncharacterized protein TREMEDRAFT_58985 [Tremella mesenterica DSM 1558]EIW72817.1 hypothetical protein TREMEDRAFT_58985 [Tremella mesenterica DSM 1558]
MRRSGLNEPSRWEREHADILSAKGRPDLSECVLVHNRKFQRLNDLLRRGLGVITDVNATKRAFLGLGDNYTDKQPRTKAKWMQEQRIQRKNGKRLAGLVNRETE